MSGMDLNVCRSKRFPRKRGRTVSGFSLTGVVPPNMPVTDPVPPIVPPSRPPLGDPPTTPVPPPIEPPPIPEQVQDVRI